MNLEIERKFLVDETEIPVDVHWDKIENLTQGYLNGIRVRIVTNLESNPVSYLTLKKRINDMTSEEFEYEIPVEDAQKLLDGVTLIRKRRYYLGRWVVDFFVDIDLTLAEIELNSEDEVVEIPEWCVKEVTNDDQYRNCNLVKQLEK